VRRAEEAAAAAAAALAEQERLTAKRCDEQKEAASDGQKHFRRTEEKRKRAAGAEGAGLMSAQNNRGGDTFADEFKLLQCPDCPHKKASKYSFDACCYESDKDKCPCITVESGRDACS
jgi:hypothetical protein